MIGVSTVLVKRSGVPVGGSVSPKTAIYHVVGITDGFPLAGLLKYAVPEARTDVMEYVDHHARGAASRWI